MRTNKHDPNMRFMGNTRVDGVLGKTNSNPNPIHKIPNKIVKFSAYPQGCCQIGFLIDI